MLAVLLTAGGGVLPILRRDLAHSGVYPVRATRYDLVLDIEEHS
jgi:hypothetical protein